MRPADGDSIWGKDMISEADLVKALHKGACKATKDYLEWSDGTFLNECAGESYMVACMAQAVMKTPSPPPYLCLEYCLSTLKDDWDKRLPSCLKGSGRLDMALLNKDKQLKFAIEAKCSTAWADNYADDIKRLMHLCRKLRKTSTDGALQACIFITSVYSYSISSMEKARKQLNEKISDWESYINDIRLNYQKQYGEIYTCFSIFPNYNVNETSDLAQISTSLCCIIK